MAECAKTLAALIHTGAMELDEFEERSVIYGTTTKMRVKENLEDDEFIEELEEFLDENNRTELVE